MASLMKQVADEKAKLLAQEARAYQELMTEEKYAAALVVLQRIELLMMDMPSRTKMLSEGAR